MFKWVRLGPGLVLLIVETLHVARWHTTYASRCKRAGQWTQNRKAGLKSLEKTLMVFKTSAAMDPKTQKSD